MKRVVLFILLACTAEAVMATAPLQSPRPAARGDVEPPSTAGVRFVSPDVPGVSVSPRPQARPAPALEKEGLAIARSTTAPDRSPRPDARPTGALPQTAARTAQPPAQSYKVAGRETSLCGERQILGTPVGAVTGELQGCGIEDGVAVTQIAGVRLSEPAVMTCQTARALKDWVEDGAQPAVGRLGGGVSALRIAAHYTCRPRNGEPGARLSEHAKGRALDISALTLKNGAEIPIESGWNKLAEGRILRRMHAAACGPFSTVLGPDADSAHRDHFHFDTAPRNGRDYCR